MVFDAMRGNPYEHAKQCAEALGPEDQLRLIADLVSGLSGQLNIQARSLLELEGLGEEVWKDVDVEEYLRQERSSWDG